MYIISYMNYILNCFLDDFGISYYHKSCNRKGERHEEKNNSVRYGRHIGPADDRMQCGH